MIARMPELSLSETSDEAEAEQAVDFLLAQHALGAALARRSARTSESSAGAADHCAAVVLDAGPGAAGRRRRRERGRGVGIERKPPLGGDGVLFDLVFGLAHVCDFTVTERRFP